MAGAEALKYLRDLVTSVCCIARSPALAAPAVPTLSVLTLALASSTPVPVVLPYTSATSLEIENFSASDWLQVTLPSPGGQLFYIPPGGSKVLAFSTPSTEICGTATFASCVDATGTAGFTTDFSVQVTSISQT